MNEQNNVSIGPTTSIGWITAFIAFIGALITYLTGDHTAKSVTAVEAGAAGLVVLLVTQGARYLQAHKLIGTQTQEVIEDVAHSIDNIPTQSSAGIPPDGDNSKVGSQVFDQEKLPPVAETPPIVAPVVEAPAQGSAQ